MEAFGLTCKIGCAFMLCLSRDSILKELWCVILWTFVSSVILKQSFKSFFGPIFVVAFSQIPFSKYVCELENKRSLTWYIYVYIYIFIHLHVYMYTSISNIPESILLSLNHWHSFSKGCAWSWRFRISSRK